MSNLIVIFIGSGIGGVFRFWISSLSYRLLGNAFPYGTLFVNTLGSFLMGILFVIILDRMPDSTPLLRSLLLIGLLGGFTTFSAFSIETVNLFEAGNIIYAILNILSNVLLCLTACFAGVLLARQF